jgi:hypothetical protein
MSAEQNIGICVQRIQGDSSAQPQCTTGLECSAEQTLMASVSKGSELTCSCNTMHKKSAESAQNKH